MTYTLGDEVDGYVLTKDGWVPRLDLDTSLFRPGHVVNGALLTGGLVWEPIRTAPAPPYRVGDVVEEYILVPCGDWVPLAGQLRDQQGAKVAPVVMPTQSAQPRRTASARTTQTQTRPHVADRPVRQAQTHTTRTQAQPRAQAQPGNAQPQSAYAQQVRTASGHPLQAHAPGYAQPSGPQYRVGQVVDGHILTAERGWVRLTESAQPTSNNKAAVWFVVVAIVVVVLLRAFS
ncbi:MAG: hypothetical protein FWE61_02880 [Micrococcales bacterium]|nr:hypothetical protein [Micrococcales bacterium]